MSIKRMSSIAGIVIVIFIILCSIRIYFLMTPTKGEKIVEYANPRKALFVVDIQEDYTGLKADSPYENAKGLINTVNEIIEIAERKNYVIVYFRQEFGNNPINWILSRGKALKGTSGAKIDSRISIVNENCFSKSQGDAFSNKELHVFLKEQQVNEIILVGIDAATLR